MILASSRALPEVGFELLLDPVSLAGLALLVLYLYFRARGRDLLPRGPSPKASFRLPEAVAVFLASFAAQFYTGMLLGSGGAPRPWVILVTWAGPVLIAVVACFALLRGRESGPPVRGALAGVLAWLATYPVVASVLVVASGLIRAAGGEPVEQEILGDLREHPAVLVVVAVVMAPFVEEVLFRGLLYPALKRHLRTGAAIAVTSVAFAAVHWNLAVSPAIFVLGLALAYVYERTGTLAAPFAFHAAFNGATVLGEVIGRG